MYKHLCEHMEQMWILFNVHIGMDLLGRTVITTSIIFLRI